jgi:hypothetical protein
MIPAAKISSGIKQFFSQMEIAGETVLPFSQI